MESGGHEEPVAVMAPEPKVELHWEYSLRKYVLLLATLVATVTYSVGFNPPEGNAAVHRAGESMFWATDHFRYLVFFHCNATVFTSSVLVIVLFLLLSIQMVEKKDVWIRLKPLRVLMGLDLLSFMGAYAVGSCHDMLTTIYTLVLMAAAVLAYLTVQMVLAWRLKSSPPTDEENIHSGHNLELEGRLRKVLMLLSTFAVSITYVAGLKPPDSPGGFWNNTGAGHLPADTILNKGHHKARLTTFFICNSTAFMASLFIIMLLLGRKLHQQTVRSREMFGCILVALVGLVGAYAAGSSRGPAATAYVVGVVAAGLVFILFLPQAYLWKQTVQRRITNSSPQRSHGPRRYRIEEQMKSYTSRSLLLLLATFATAITYQAGLEPPGGVWQENGNGYLAGDPILLTMNASRYRTFLLCNSFAFVASLVTVILFLSKILLRVHMVESVMILELLGLIGAYAAGVSRDISTSIYVMALGGAVLFYVVIHVIFFTLEQDGVDFYVEQAEVEKKRKLLYLLATLSTAMTYQAGLTPPGGFWLQDDNESGHQAGDPVLLDYYPRRYKAFFYCNSVSFLLSVTTMILLVSPVLYRPAIRSYALTLCTVVGLSFLMAAYAAGSGRHLTTSVGIIVLVAVAFMILVVLLLIFLVRDTRLRRTATLMRAEAHEEDPSINAQEGELILNGDEQAKKNQRAQLKYLMLLGILLAGVTYQAGLDPPDGVWQSEAGGPVMPDSRRRFYLAFFYSNSTSFAASIVAILLLLLQWLMKKEGSHVRVMHMVILLDLLSLLVAYAAGCTRGYWRSLVYIVSLTVLVLACIAVKTTIHFLVRRSTPAQ